MAKRLKYAKEILSEIIVKNNSNKNNVNNNPVMNALPNSNTIS